MINFLYTIIIYPLYQIIEFVYRVFFELCSNIGFSVIGVSIAVTLFCLPLYAVAENWQQLERDTQKKLKPGVDRIKKSFKGDEQYMMLSTFYKQNHYHPIMSLRSSFGLLIQIPFFIAAYIFLENNRELAGQSFLFIRNMGAPDKLFSIGSFAVNILPIAMTLINIAAGVIYTKGFPVREKIQIYGMALIFLIILYNSPAGLVLYWTMNNVFSLVKNIFYKLKNPLKAFWLMMSFFFLCGDIYVSLTIKSAKVVPILFISLFVFAAPLLTRAVNRFISVVFPVMLADSRKRHFYFIISAVSLAILCGFVIPSFLITSSTPDYCYIDNYTTPLPFLFNSILQSLGLFVFWPVCIYFLFGKKTQTGIAALFFFGIFFSLINNFGFQGDYGTILPEMVFSEHKSFRPSLQVFFLNTAVLVAVTLLLVWLFRKKFDGILRALTTLTCIALVGVSGINTIFILSGYSKIPKPDPQLSDIKPIIQLSKTGKNVIVFMLDRAAGYLIQDTFTECPELYNQFTGFTFYPNTISFGSWTIQGAPGLFGGYEYTPWSMNHKRNLPMVTKHNQSLTMLPFMFEKAGFTCNVIDPPYPNYDTEPVFSIFDGHSDVHPHHARGKYDDIWYKEHNYKPLPIKSMLIKRNFIWFSLFKIVPPVLRSAVHYQNWWSSPTAIKTNSDFIDCYSVLDYLPKLTDTDSLKNGYLQIDSEATHDTALCQAPEYVPREEITNYGHSKFSHDKGFHGLAASLKRIGIWFDYLKANGVYDNTRIIIIADHGSNQRLPDVFADSAPMPRTYEWFNPMLMVKDFGSSGSLKTDMTFMTQADTPALAVDGVIANAVNPFTGNKIRKLSAEEKNAQAIVSVSKANAVRSTENNGLKIKDTDWYAVHDNTFIKSNWKQLYPETK
jgi:YidC/Oxa1 family membrane protein insertase